MKLVKLQNENTSSSTVRVFALIARGESSVHNVLPVPAVFNRAATNVKQNRRCSKMQMLYRYTFWCVGRIYVIEHYIAHTKGRTVIMFSGYGAVNIRSFKTVGAVACPRLCQFSFISLFVWFAAVRRGRPPAFQRRLQPEMAGAPLPA
jgi:hypothetical protein